MKFIFVIFILSVIISYKAFSINDTVRISRNLIYLEIAGVGGYGSVNYERLLFSKSKVMFATRFGFSSYHIKDYTNKFHPDILIPFSIFGFYGKNHKFEIGLGQTFTKITHASLNDFASKRVTNFHTNMSIGYCYQKLTGGLMFRIGYTPIIEFNKYYRHWAGISFGYSF